MCEVERAIQHKTTCHLKEAQPIKFTRSVVRELEMVTQENRIS